MRSNFLSWSAERYLNDLRDTADQDYLLGRVAIRRELDTQFLWLSQQAVEKYLKLLLVFNGESALKITHDLEVLFERVLEVPDIPFAFPAVVADVATYLNLRANRYAERSYAVSLRRLCDLDEAVWHLRRFCANVRGNREKRLQLSEEQIRADIARRASVEFSERPEAFWLTNGYLEKIRRNLTSPLRRDLLWKNRCYRPSRRVTGSFTRAVNTYLVLSPTVIPELHMLLHFTGTGVRRVGHIRCALCGKPARASECVRIKGRGRLCPDCIAAIEATIDDPSC
jgi:HEPN domain-containing protein